MRLTTKILSAALLAAAVTAGGTLGALGASDSVPKSSPVAAAPAASTAGPDRTGDRLDRSMLTHGTADTSGLPDSTSDGPLFDTKGAGPRVVPMASGSSQAWTTVSCDGILHKVDLDVHATPDARWTTIAYRPYFYFYATGGGVWDDWETMPVPGEVLEMRNLPPELGTNSYAVYMQYAWSDGAGWTDTVGAWVGTYTQQDLYGYHDDTTCTA